MVLRPLSASLRVGLALALLATRLPSTIGLWPLSYHDPPAAEPTPSTEPLSVGVSAFGAAEPVPAVATAECVDQSTDCLGWARMGECDSSTRG